MNGGLGGHERRRKRLLRVAPLARSHSLDSISPISPGRPSGSSGTSGRIEKRRQHLPPLGRKDGRHCSVNSTVQRELSKGKNRHALGRSSSSPEPVPDDDSPTGATMLPKTEWAACADLFVQAGQTAGIVFQWMENIPAAAGAVVAGLAVVNVAEGSLAARHGGVFPGMVLVEVNRESFAGMGQDQVMHMMRVMASQPRVLSLARVRTPSSGSSSPPAGGSSTTSVELRSQYATSTLSATSFTTRDYGSTGNGGGQQRANTDTTVQRRSSGESSQPRSRPQSSSSSVADSDYGDGASIGSSNSARSSLFCIQTDTRPGSDGPSLSAASDTTCHHHHHRLPSSSCPQITIALRFVGSRGDMSLFDRDHVLGLKTRDIEFLPPNNTMGDKESPSMTVAARHHRANSQRSLQDLTRDWRNDPFSTPARRRRLINDACKVIFRSYTHAAVWRVAEIRREESSAIAIQAAFRMKSARRLFLEKRSVRRREAASIVQLGWLSCLARRRTGALREERDRDRRVEEERRKKRQAHERLERSRREEEERERERERDERETRRRRKKSLVVFIQRRFRAKQQERRRRVQELERLRLERLREDDLLRAATFVQAVIRRRQQRLRREKKLAYQIARDNAASARLQRAWRRYKAERGPDRQLHTRSGKPTFSLLAIDDRVAQNQTAKALPGSQSLPNTEGDSLRSPTKKSQRHSGGLGASGSSGEMLSWERLSSALGVNPSLAAEVAREGEGESAAKGTRPRTAAAAVETSVSTSSRRQQTHPPPPAGMMTVTVRRGSEETSLVTPIVLTESGEEEAGSTTTSSVFAASARGDMEITAGFPSLDNGTEDGKSRPLAEPLSACEHDAETQVLSARNGGRAAAVSTVHAKEPSARKEVAGRQEMFCKAQESAEASLLPTSNLDSGMLAADIAGLPSPAFTVARVNNRTENSLALPAQQTTTSESRLLGAGTMAAALESVEGASRTVVKPEEQLFMEDTQVYLGCAVCGVKYLVEAVDPGQSNSAQGQPAPEVLYLCTTCGGALRNNGEDGRWRRRRRPSSAPAAGRRRGGTASFVGGGGNAGGRKNNAFVRSVTEGWNGSKPATGGTLLEEGDHTGPPLHDEGTGSRGRNASARLRYAHSARTIQHAYREFRHRQYLRDWAFSLLRRWLLHRVQSWKRANRHLVRRLAAVTLQSATRAAAARARCSALRAARLHLWTGRVAAPCADAPGVEDYVYEFPPSPAAVDLLRERSVPPPRPPPARASSPSSSSYLSAAGAVPRERGVKSRSGAQKGRALAEALAPRMGQPPPGCPAALDVDWGEWGVGLRVVFPVTPRAG